MERNPIAAAAREYAENAGAHQPEKEWILTPYDSWELNPHYRGEPGMHPECMNDIDEDDRQPTTYTEYQDLYGGDDSDDVPF